MNWTLRVKAHGNSLASNIEKNGIALFCMLLYWEDSLDG